LRAISSMNLGTPALDPCEIEHLVDRLEQKRAGLQRVGDALALALVELAATARLSCR